MKSFMLCGDCGMPEGTVHRGACPRSPGNNGGDPLGTAPVVPAECDEARVTPPLHWHKAPDPLRPCESCGKPWPYHDPGCESLVERNLAGRDMQYAGLLADTIASAVHSRLREMFGQKAAGQDEADPWAHRSAGMRCSTCMWFVQKRPDDGGILVPDKIVGRCRRHAPTMSGYPVVFVDDWCGDHKIDEGKVKR